MQKSIYVIFTLLFAILLMHTNSIFASENTDDTNWDDDTVISVSIIGSDVIDLDTSNRFVRAYVDITNFDPRDGYYFMNIIQPVTGVAVSEEEILIREKSNGQAGADVAYLIHDEDIMINGTAIRGDYEILITTEKGEITGSTSFKIVKGSDSHLSSVPITDDDNSEENLEITPVQMSADVESINTETDIDENDVEELTDSKNESSEIPQWVRTIFMLYADGSISESELLTALKFLIEQNIIEL